MSQLQDRVHDLRLRVREHHDLDLILGVAQPSHELLDDPRRDDRVVREQVLERRLIERQRWLDLAGPLDEQLNGAVLRQRCAALRRRRGVSGFW